MKAIFISYNQAYGEEIVELLARHGQRGFTQWQDIQGRGNADGEAHFGNHAWPVMNFAVFTVVPDEKVSEIMEDLKGTDEESKDLGLRAFVLPVEQMI